MSNAVSKDQTNLSFLVVHMPIDLLDRSSGTWNGIFSHGFNERRRICVTLGDELKVNCTRFYY